MTSWQLALPPGLELLNANERLHWTVRARRTRALREAGRMLALAAGIPRLDAVMAIGYVHPATRRQRWDPPNWYPSFKPFVDGALVDSGVLVDDDHAHLSGPYMLPGGRRPGGGLTLVVAPVERCRCGHDRLEHPASVACVRPSCGCSEYLSEAAS